MVERIEDTCIRIRSEMNEWMDCIFIVSEEDAARAEKVLQEAWDFGRRMRLSSMQ